MKQTAIFLGLIAMAAFGQAAELAKPAGVPVALAPPSSTQPNSPGIKLATNCDTWLNPSTAEIGPLRRTANSVCLDEYETIFSGLTFNELKTTLETVTVTKKREVISLCTQVGCWDELGFSTAAERARMLGFRELAAELVLMRDVKKLDICPSVPGTLASDTYYLKAAAAIGSAAGADIRKGDTAEVRYGDGSSHTFEVQGPVQGGIAVRYLHSGGGLQPKCK